jgi:hypothetical protein
MESTFNKQRLENGYSDVQQDKSLMMTTEVLNAPAAALGSDDPFLGSLAGLANFVGIKNLRGLSNAFIKAFNVVKKVEYSALDTDLLWPRCYGDRVKSLLKESDNLGNIAIKLHLQRCPLVGIGKIKDAMSKLVREFGIDHQKATKIGEQLDFTQFVDKSNEQLRRNIEDGLTTLHSRVLDTNVQYLYDYVIDPLYFHTNSHFEFVYIDPDYVEYIARQESEKVSTHMKKLGLHLPPKRGISSVKEITWLRHTRLLAGTFTAVYHITKELPEVTLNIRRGAAPSARCSLGLDASNNSNYSTAFFVQMGEWDIGLDSVGRALPFKEEDDIKIKNDLIQEVKKGTINRSTDQCRSVIEQLINIEQGICTNNLFSGGIEPIIGRMYGEIIDSNRHKDTTVNDWLKDIILKVSHQQKEIEEKIMPDIREKFEPRIIYA